MTNTNNTIQFYNENADEFYSSTIEVDMAPIYEKFTAMLDPGAFVLDAGCGSGRDTLYFIENGYSCEAFDASSDLVNLAKKLTNADVKCSTFDKINYEDAFDAIWACASLLHVPSNELDSSLKNLSNLLKLNGVFYMSFKYGEFEGNRNGRYFTDMNEQKLSSYLESCKLKIVESWKTSDLREGRETEEWLNILATKQA